MIRKQISIEEHHNALLKKMAEDRGVSEAEVMRDAIEQFGRQGGVGMYPDADAAAELLRFFEGLGSRKKVAKGRRWKRADLHERR